MSIASAVPQLPIHRLTVGQYHKMIETGVLTEDDRVELLEGWMVSKMPHNPAHDGTIMRIQKRLERELDEQWLIRIQSSFTTGDSEPEPDLLIVSAPVDQYLSRHPVPGDAALVIEVSDATLESDREIKGRLYARAKLPAYWIANLRDKLIESYTEPKQGKRAHFRKRQDFEIDDEIPLIIDGMEVARISVSDLLPS